MSSKRLDLPTAAAHGCRALSHCDLSAGYLGPAQSAGVFDRITALLVAASAAPGLLEQGSRGGPLLLLASESLVEALVALAVGRPGQERSAPRQMVTHLINAMVRCFDVADVMRSASGGSAGQEEAGASAAEDAAAAPSPLESTALQVSLTRMSRAARPAGPPDMSNLSNQRSTPSWASAPAS